MINNRQGGRRRGRGGGPPRSSAPGPGNRQDNRQRGNAAQLLEKYKGLARDAQMQGDRVLTENYLQYADHYFRVLGESRPRFEEQPRQRDDYQDDDDDRDNEGGGDDSDPDDRDMIDPEPRREPQPRELRAERDRPQQQREPRPDREEGNGEFRARRPRMHRAEAAEEGGERIALDVLPPAISAANEGDDAPGQAPRRRVRRPRGSDEDIAPAA